jgi:type IV pilus assembly protein PilA
MKKISKNKKGFTLVEMVIVIAIILILASVIIFSVSKFINAAKSAQGSVSQHNSHIEEVANDPQINQFFQ